MALTLKLESVKSVFGVLLFRLVLSCLLTPHPLIPPHRPPPFYLYIHTHLQSSSYTHYVNSLLALQHSHCRVRPEGIVKISLPVCFANVQVIRSLRPVLTALFKSNCSSPVTIQTRLPTECTHRHSKAPLYLLGNSQRCTSLQTVCGCFLSRCS